MAPGQNRFNQAGPRLSAARFSAFIKDPIPAFPPTTSKIFPAPRFAFRQRTFDAQMRAQTEAQRAGI